MAEAIKGLKDIQKFLSSFDERSVRNINRSAARAGAKAVEKEAYTRLPPHHKRKLGVQRNRKLSRRGAETFSIGPLAKHWALAFYEYGAPAHEVTAKRAKNLAIRSRNSSGGRTLVAVIGPKVEVGGVKKTMFLSLALISGKDEALNRMGVQYWRRIKKQIKGK